MPIQWPRGLRRVARLLRLGVRIPPVAWTSVSTECDASECDREASITRRALASGVPRNFDRGGGSTNSVEDRENEDLGAVALQSGVLEAAVILYKKFHLI